MVRTFLCGWGKPWEACLVLRAAWLLATTRQASCDCVARTQESGPTLQVTLNSERSTLNPPPERCRFGLQTLGLRQVFGLQMQIEWDDERVCRSTTAPRTPWKSVCSPPSTKPVLSSEPDWQANGNHPGRLRMWSAVRKNVIFSSEARSGSLICSSMARFMHSNHWSRSLSPIGNGRCRARNIG